MYDYPWIITKMDTDIVETRKNKDSVKCNIIVVLDEHNRVAITGSKYIVLNITSEQYNPIKITGLFKRGSLCSRRGHARTLTRTWYSIASHRSLHWRLEASLVLL